MWAIEKFEENNSNRHIFEKAVGNLRVFNSGALGRLSNHSPQKDGSGGSNDDKHPDHSMKADEDSRYKSPLPPRPTYNYEVDSNSSAERFPQTYYHRPANQEERRLDRGTRQ